MKVFATPGYLSALKEHGIDATLFAPASKALAALSKGGDPSWVIGDPLVQVDTGIPEDEGRTLKVPSSFKFYAIRDDHPADCSCGCVGVSIVTFLLPEEY